MTKNINCHRIRKDDFINIWTRVIGIILSAIIFCVPFVVLIGESDKNNIVTQDEVFTPDMATKDEITLPITETPIETNTTFTIKSTKMETTEKQVVEKLKEPLFTENVQIETIENEPTETIVNNYYSESELDLVARTIYLEAGSCSEYCQWLVGSTIINLADKNGGIDNVVTNANMFSVAPYLYTRTPNDLSYSVAKRVLSGDRDYNVMAFREGYYHSFGSPYTNVDSVYFSTY